MVTTMGFINKGGRGDGECEGVSPPVPYPGSSHADTEFFERIIEEFPRRSYVQAENLAKEILEATAVEAEKNLQKKLQKDWAQYFAREGRKHVCRFGDGTIPGARFNLKYDGRRGRRLASQVLEWVTAKEDFVDDDDYELDPEEFSELQAMVGSWLMNPMFTQTRENAKKICWMNGDEQGRHSRLPLSSTSTRGSSMSETTSTRVGWESPHTHLKSPRQFSTVGHDIPRSVPEAHYRDVDHAASSPHWVQTSTITIRQVDILHDLGCHSRR
jgi:hypothetical protein